VINANLKKKDYFILVYTNMQDIAPFHDGTRPAREGHVLVKGTRLINTKLILMSRRPPKMLGTMCYHVDNTRGKLIRLWGLPFDLPRLEREISDEATEEIFRSAQGMPIVH